MTRAERFVERYVEAWRTNDADDIRSMFADDAMYRGSPSDDEPMIGIAAIVDGWFADRDEPGTWEFTWHVVTETADLAVVQGVTRYVDGPTFDNLWVVRLGADGRAVDFTEWYMERADEE